MFVNIAGNDPSAALMAALAAFFALEALTLAALLFRRRDRKKKLFAAANPELEYKASEITGAAFSSATLLFLAFMKARYFSDADKAFGALVPIAALMCINIIARVAGFFGGGRGAVSGAFLSSALRGMDDFATAALLACSPALLASQMPVVEISKYFGAEVRRAALVEFPFVLSAAYMLLSNLVLMAQNLMARAKPRHVNEAAELLLFALVSFLCAGAYVPGYNLFLILVVGVISACIISSASQYLNANRIGGRRSLPSGLSRLYTMSNLLTSTFSSMLIMCAAIFTSLNLGGFYGMSVVGLAMVGSWALNGSLDVLYRRSEANKYVAKTINNVVLFYIFYETLEFMLKRRVSINIFSNNAVIGLFLSASLVVFNILKVVNLAKYLETLKNKSYIFIRSLIYMALFVVCVYLLFPFINHELMSAFILGLVITTSFVSLALLNGADVFDMVAPRAGARGDIMKDTIVPLESQITTLLIILTIILLPMVK
jgi:hypothetical protein